MNEILSPVPSLSSATNPPSTVPSSTIDTALASDLVAHEILEEDGAGALVVPRRAPHIITAGAITGITGTGGDAADTGDGAGTGSGDDAGTGAEADAGAGTETGTGQGIIYTCLFPILNCHETFTDIAHWKTHVLSHFQTHEPPSTAQCPICPLIHTSTTSSSSQTTATFVNNDTTRAWDALLDHISTTHSPAGHTLTNTRPDLELLRYLFRLRIIGEEQLKVVQLGFRPGSAAYGRGQEGVRVRVGREEEPFWGVYSRRRERRGREGREGGRSAVVL